MGLSTVTVNTHNKSLGAISHRWHRTGGTRR